MCSLVTRSIQVQMGWTLRTTLKIYRFKWSFTYLPFWGWSHAKCSCKQAPKIYHFPKPTYVGTSVDWGWMEWTGSHWKKPDSMTDIRENSATTWLSDGSRTTALDKRDGREPLWQRRDRPSERWYCFSLLGTPFLKKLVFCRITAFIS